MTAFRRFAVALTASSVLNTSLALPTAESSTSAVSFPNTDCWIHSEGATNTYSISVPAPYGDDTCGNGHDTLMQFAAVYGGDWSCKSNGGLITLMTITTWDGNAEKINETMGETFPDFTFQCVNNVDSSAALSLKKNDSPTDPAYCTFGNNQNTNYDDYSVYMPFGYSDEQCSQAKAALLQDIGGFDASTWQCNKVDDWTVMFFKASKGEYEHVDSALKTVYPSYKSLCFEVPSIHGASLSSTKALDGAPPPTCAVQEQDFNSDAYGLVVPTTYSKTKCQKAKSALQPYMEGHKNDYVCTQYGSGTILVFFATKNSAANINNAMHQAYPKLTFSCTRSKAASLIRSVDPPAQCTVQDQGVYDKYSLTVPTPYSDAACATAQSAIHPFAHDLASEWECQNYGAGFTMIVLGAQKHAAGSINVAMATAFPSVAFQCAN